MKKSEIYAEIEKAIACLDKNDTDGCRIILKAIKSNLHSDVVKGKACSDDIVTDQTLCEIILDKACSASQIVREQNRRILNHNGRYYHMNSHMIADAERPIDGFPIQTPDENTARAIDDIVNVDYETPDTKSFRCPNLMDIKANLKELHVKYVNNSVAYHFPDGPAVKATYLMWAIMLTGATHVYTKYGMSQGRRIWNKMLYFPGEKISVWVCPIVSTGDTPVGYYRRDGVYATSNLQSAY